MEIARVWIPSGAVLSYRPASDKYVVAESMNKLPFYYKHGDILKADTVLEVGAHIGITSAWVAGMASLVVACEAEAQNYGYLERNMAQFKNVHCQWAFVCGNSRTGEVIDFYLSSKMASAHSAYIKRGRVKVSVPIVTVGQLLNSYRPEVVKMDCEGAEWELIYDGLLERGTLPQVITFEVHFGRKEWREKYPDMLARLRSAGYRVAAKEEPGRAWHSYVHASRRL